MSKMDELIDIWLSNVNFTVSHPNDMDRFNKIVMHGYRYIRNFNSTYLRNKIDERDHYFDNDDLDDLMNRVDSLLAFCRSNFPKPPTREQLEYNRRFDPENGLYRRQSQS